MSSTPFNFAQDVIDLLAAEQRVGLIFIDEYGHRRDYSFAEIALLSRRYAGALHNFGVTANARVALYTANTAKCLFATLGLVRLGAVVMPYSHENADAVIADRSRREQCEALRVDAGEPARFLLIGEEREGWLRLDRMSEQAPALAGIVTYASDPACVLEGVTYDRGSLAQASADAKDALHASSGDVVWCTVPMGSERWYANVFVGPWSCGAATVVHDSPFQPAERLELIRELDVSTLLQPAEEYAQETSGISLERFRAPRLRTCLAFDGDVSPETAENWKRATRLAIDGAAGGIRLAAP